MINNFLRIIAEMVSFNQCFRCPIAETTIFTLETKIIFFLNSDIIMLDIIERHFGILISLNYQEVLKQPELSKDNC